MHFPRTPPLRLRASLPAVLAAGCLSGCGTLGPAPAAIANLAPTATVAPNPTLGKVTFTPLDHGLRIAGEVHGLAPGTEHGFQIHETGDCGDNGNAAGDHFNPSGGTHGKFAAPGSHAGDLPSLVADASGIARFSFDVHTLSMTDGAANNVIGRALVVHRDRDDFTTQPSGNSGPPIACGVITHN
jgi:superoxide dismutase, Cu-Zn family